LKNLLDIGKKIYTSTLNLKPSFTHLFVNCPGQEKAKGLLRLSSQAAMYDTTSLTSQR